MFANYLSGGIQLAPLNEYVEPLKDQLVMSRFENYAKDGNYYGIDYHIGATVMFYNTEVLEAAGVDYKSIASWDDYHEAGKKVLEATGKPMTTWESTDCWNIYPLVNQHGGDWLTPDNEVRMDEPVVVNTLTFMKGMLDDGTAVPCPGGLPSRGGILRLDERGGAASVVMPFWYAGRFTNYMPDLKGRSRSRRCHCGPTAATRPRRWAAPAPPWSRPAPTRKPPRNSWPLPAEQGRQRGYFGESWA